MEQKESASSRVLTWKDLSIEFAVGIFFFSALVILAVFTIVLSKDHFFADRIPMTVHFEQVSGLSEGDNVRIRGVQVGVVKKVELTHEGVDVLLSLAEKVPLYQDYVIEVRSASMLGGYYVAIEPGGQVPDTDTIAADERITGAPPPEIMHEAGKLIQSLQTELERIGDAMADENVINKVAALVNNFHQISNDLRSGKGTLGKLIYDEQFYESTTAMMESAKKASDGVDEAAQNLSDVITGIKEGRGTLGKLVTDDALYNQATAIVADVRAGKGTLGKLLSDEELHQNLTQMSQDLRLIISRIEEGESSFGKFISDDGELYRQLHSVLQNAADIAASVRDGEGTLGRLVKDEGLYEDARKTVDEIRNAIEDFREQAPISTFGSLLFGAF